MVQVLNTASGAIEDGVYRLKMRRVGWDREFYIVIDFFVMFHDWSTKVILHVAWEPLNGFFNGIQNLVVHEFAENLLVRFFKDLREDVQSSK